MELEAADLIESLREPGESYENLAARLPISLSTLYRWKRGSPENWEVIVKMLGLAGWINEDRIRVATAPAEAEAAAKEAEREARDLADRRARARDKRRSA